ncbi:MAG: hypothetical protein ABL917_01200 [Parcubacteria group bacterium]
MQQLIDSYSKSKTLHHAYFLVGEVEELFLKLSEFLQEEVGVKIAGNPDFWHGKFQNFNIENSRDISTRQERKDFSLGKKVFIIQTDFITEEAQNSLLKVFEEPTPGTHFFIISPQDILLPTFRSRVQVIYSNKGDKAKTKFLDMKMKERLALVKEITDEISDEEKTKQDAIALLNQIETELYEAGVEKSAKALEVASLARQSLYDRGAPIKVILENLMLSI